MMEGRVQPAKTSLEPRELFTASLVATALVYSVGILVIAILIGLTSEEGWLGKSLTFLAFFGTIGAGAATLAGLVLVAPLGTAFGKLMLRLTPPAWWQGAVTGVLVALTLVAATLLLFSLGGQPMEPGLFAMAAIPILLSPFAGTIVQRRMLKWPEAATPA